MKKDLKLSGVVLAGGLGTRVRHLYPDLPKPMIPVEGKPFLEWVLRCFKEKGITRFYISTGFLAEKVENYFSTGFSHLQLSFHPESEALGTAGGFLNSVGRDKDTDYFVVLNGDSLALFDFGRVLEILKSKNPPDVLIVGVRVEDAGRFGQLKVDDKGNLIRFVEKKPGSGLINAGIYFMAAKCLDEFPQNRPLSFENDVFPILIARGYRIQVEDSTSDFIDIGVPSSLEKASEFVKKISFFKIE